VSDTIRLGIAAESAADALSIADLADRVVVETVDWLDAESWQVMRAWCSDEDAGEPGRSVAGDASVPYVDLHHAFRRARERGLRVYGKFSGEPGALDAGMFRALLMLFARPDAVVVEAVVIGRDLDGDENRRRGFEQAVHDDNTCWPFKVIPALAQPELEAWVIACWRVETDEDESRLDAVRKRLGFNPVRQAHRLRSGRSEHPKDAKRVARELMGDAGALRAVWARVGSEQARGAPPGTGLPAFVQACEVFARDVVDGRGRR
jgi:hypothetical protein